MEGWTCYVDDTFAFIEPGKEQEVLQKLNSYDPKIQFTFETEKNNTIPFLDVLIRRTENNQLETTVYRKKTNNGIYMNWNSHSPQAWKVGTLKNLIRRAAMICSQPEDLQREINHLEKVFCETNEYPTSIVKRIIEEERTRRQQRQREEATEPPETNNQEEEEEEEGE